jgi:hypothetical protein
MPSKARTAFDENASDVDRLLEIHANLGGDSKGRRFRLEVLNKSAVVLITAFWEAYCEDLVAEALEYIVKRAANSSVLPVELKRKVAKELKANPNEIAIWQLADQGWRGLLEGRLKNLSEERSRRLNTPKSSNIIDLFSVALGIDDISTRWRWGRKSVKQAKADLDWFIELRGAIAHRGQAEISCTKWQVTEYFNLVKRLVGTTDPLIDDVLHGRPL